MAEIILNVCQDCGTKSGSKPKPYPVGVWLGVCCVGRLIANTPQLARRRTMLDWYEKTKGKTFTEEVKQVILDRFKTERKV